MDKEKENEISIVYVGNDDSYWGKIQDKYKRMYPEINFCFEIIQKPEKEKIKTVIHKLTTNNYQIIYLDYTGDDPEMLRLANNLQRDPTTSDAAIVALLDSMESRRSLTVSLSFGIYLNFIKSDDLSSVVHHPMCIAFPEKSKDTEYALARIGFDAIATTNFKIGYITQEYIHLECDFEFELDREIKIKTNFILDTPLTNIYKIKSTRNYNLYSNFEHAYDFEYNHTDPKQVDHINSDITKKQKEFEENPKDKNIKYDLDELTNSLTLIQKESEVDVNKRIQAIANFIELNSGKSASKKTRLLIFDRKMRFLFNEPKHIDTYNFSCRFLSQPIGGEKCFIKKTTPGVIAVHLDSPNESITLDQPTDINRLKKMIEQVKSLNLVNPFFVIFNIEIPTGELISELQYPSLIATTNPLDFELLKQIIESYEEKGGRKITHLKYDQSREDIPKFIISKYDPRSYGFFDLQFSVKAISETDILFTCVDKIPLYTSFYVKYPVKMTVTVVPPKKNSRLAIEKGDYYGLISGLGESEIAGLRQFVNKLFFKELDEKKAEEKAKFKELNKEKSSKSESKEKK